MPKSRKLVAKGRPTISQHVKFKIGGRKSTTSALRVPTQELLDKYQSTTTRGRDKPRIQQALARRRIVV